MQIDFIVWLLQRGSMNTLYWRVQLVCLRLRFQKGLRLLVNSRSSENGKIGTPKGTRVFLKSCFKKSYFSIRGNTGYKDN